jgi:hypothetical protein
MVVNPVSGGTALIPDSVSAGTKGKNLHSDLRRIGLIDALEEAGLRKAEERARKLADGKAATDRAIAEANAAAAPPQVMFTPPEPAPTNGNGNGVAVARPKPPTQPAKVIVPGRNAKPATVDGPPEMFIVKVTVTPELALEWLTRDEARLPDGATVKQRPISQTHRDKLLRYLRDDEWLLTSQGVALAPEAPWNTGAVLDGQHRLAAIIEWGEPVDMMVAFNADPATFKTLDTGKPRNAADIMAMLGLNQRQHAASVAKLVYVWQMSLDDPGAFADWRNWPRYTVSNTEMVDVIHKYPDLLDRMNETRALVAKPVNFNLPAATVFRMWVEQVWPEGTRPGPHGLSYVDQWLVQLRNGIGINEEDDPTATLRNWALDPKKITKLYGGAVREVCLLAMCRVWNSKVVGRGLTYLNIKGTDLMPVPRRGPFKGEDYRYEWEEWQEFWENQAGKGKSGK